MKKPSRRELLIANSLEVSQNFEPNQDDSDYNAYIQNKKYFPELDSSDEDETTREKASVIVYQREQQEGLDQQSNLQTEFLKKSATMSLPGFKQLKSFKRVFEYIEQNKEDSSIKDIDLPRDVSILISTQDNKIIYYTEQLQKKQKNSESIQTTKTTQKTTSSDTLQQNLKPFAGTNNNKSNLKSFLPPINQKARMEDYKISEEEEIKIDNSPTKQASKYEYKIYVYNLADQTQEETIQLKQKVFKLFYGKNGKHLFIAYMSGLIEVRDMWKIKQQGKIYKNLARIHYIVTDDSDFFIASDVQGRVVYIKMSQEQDKQGYKDFQNKGERAFTHLMLTPDNKVLIGLQNQLTTHTSQQSSFLNLKFVIWSLKDLNKLKRIESITILLQDQKIMVKSIIRKLARKFSIHQKRKNSADSSSQQSDGEDNKSLAVVSHISELEEQEDIKESVQKQPETLISKLQKANTLININKRKPEQKLQLNEKVSKISQITHDSKYLIVRDQEFKGVQIISLMDGSIINEYKEIHKQTIAEILISKNNSYIITAGKDNKVKVFDFLKERVVATLASHHKPVTSIQFTPDQNYLFSYGLGVQVILWSTKTWQKLCFFKTQFIVQDLIVTKDQRFLILEGEDLSRVQYLEIEQNRESQRIEADEDEIQDARITPNEEYISFINRDSSISFWNLKEGMLCTKIHTEAPQIEIMFNENRFYYIDKGELFVYDPEVNLQNSEKIQIHEGSEIPNDINYFLINKDGSKIFLLSQRVTILVQSEEGYIPTDGPLKRDTLYIQGCLSTDEQYLFALSDYMGTQTNKQIYQSIHMYEIDGSKMKINTKIRLQLKALHDVCCGPNAQFIFICGDSTDIIYYNFKEDQKQQLESKSRNLFQELRGHIKPPNQIALTKHSRYVVSKNDCEIIIWNSAPAQLLSIIDGYFILVLSKEQKLFGLVHRHQYKKWSQKLIEQLSDDKVPLERSFDSSLPQSQSEVLGDKYPTEVVIGGHVNKLFTKILANFKSESKEVQLKFVPAIAKSNIQPFKINMLHYFAYENNQHALHACLDLGVKYQRDFFKFTPLQYAFKNNCVESINYLLKYISNKTNLYTQMHQKEIVKAIKTSSLELEHFFNSSVYIQDQNMPQFGKVKGSGVYFNESDSLVLDPRDAQSIFLKDKLIKNTKNNNGDQVQQQKTKKTKKPRKIPIQFKAIKFKLNFVPGSKDSLKFHIALSETDADSIFKTEAIKMILKYKWQKVRIYSLINVTPLIIFASVLFVHSLYGRYNSDYLIFFAVFGGIFSIIEGVQMIVNFTGYFTDFWNIIDLVRLIFIYVYIFLQYDLIKKLNNIPPEYEYCLDLVDEVYCLPYEYYYPQNTLVVLNSLVWIRILSYLRLFKQTRALIRLLIEVIKDMFSFTIVLVMALVAFAINYTNLNNNNFKDDDGIQQFSTQMKSTFLLVFSNFQEDKYSLSNQMILFVFAAVLVPLIMLNMLIAIMGDTFERVSSTKIETDGRELNLLILEQESLMFWVRDKKQNPSKVQDSKQRREQKDEHHLHWAIEFGNLQKWTGRLQVIQQTIFEASQTGRDHDQLEQVMQKFNESSKKQFNSLTLRFQQFQKSVKRQIRSLKNQGQDKDQQQPQQKAKRSTLKQLTLSPQKSLKMKKRSISNEVKHISQNEKVLPSYEISEEESDQ